MVSSRFLAVFLLFLFLFLILQTPGAAAEEDLHGGASGKCSDPMLNGKGILREADGVSTADGNVIRMGTEEIDEVEEGSLAVMRSDDDEEEGILVAKELEAEAGAESLEAAKKEGTGEVESVMTVVNASLSCPARCFRLNPVCGVDGQTYWCGPVDAECSGVAVDYAGFCESVSKGSVGGKALESLLLVHMVWLILTAVFLLFGTP
jgi:hypothetical protein